MIKGISSIYRPVRQGKIHLGVKKTKKTERGDVEYPSEVDFFVLKDAPELIPIYGETPKSLNVTLPSSRFERGDFNSYMEKVFPQFLKRYKKTGLICKGDGETASAVTEKGIEEIECPCQFLETGECKRIGIIRIRVQEIAQFGIYQITTGSFNSIVNINSFIRDLAEHCVVNGIDISSVKLVLQRREITTQRLEKGEMKSSRHHAMVLDLDPRYYKNLDSVRVKSLPQSMARPKELPPPDETKDELYYPPKDEAEDGEEKNNDAEMAEERRIEGARVRCELIFDELVAMGGKITPGEIKGNNALKTYEDFEKAARYYQGRIEAFKKAVKKP